jgi:hypothetical protein
VHTHTHAHVRLCFTVFINILISTEYKLVKRTQSQYKTIVTKYYSSIVRVSNIQR